jgi:hypothetical protein
VILSRTLLELADYAVRRSNPRTLDPLLQNQALGKPSMPKGRVEQSTRINRQVQRREPDQAVGRERGHQQVGRLSQN